MKKYEVIMVQKTYFRIEVEAEDELSAELAAYDVATSEIEPIGYEADVYEVMEVE